MNFGEVVKWKFWNFWKCEVSVCGVHFFHILTASSRVLARATFVSSEIGHFMLVRDAVRSDNFSRLLSLATTTCARVACWNVFWKTCALRLRCRLAECARGKLFQQIAYQKIFGKIAQKIRQHLSSDAASLGHLAAGCIVQTKFRQGGC